MLRLTEKQPSQNQIICGIDLTSRLVSNIFQAAATFDSWLIKRLFSRQTDPLVMTSCLHVSRFVRLKDQFSLLSKYQILIFLKLEAAFLIEWT